MFTRSRIQVVKSSVYPCSWCKQCERVRALERYHANRDKCMQQNKEYKKKNQEVIKEKRRDYLQQNKEHVKQRYKACCDQNKEKINQIARDYRQNNIHVKLRNSFSSRLREYLSKDKSTLDYMGTSIGLIKRWLEFNFDSMMTWENYGKYWHIDHTLPLKVFDMNSDYDIVLAFNWMNLMPLEKVKNISKGCKIQVPRVLFQKMRLRQFFKKEETLDIHDLKTYIFGYASKFNELYCAT